MRVVRFVLAVLVLVPAAASAEPAERRDPFASLIDEKPPEPTDLSPLERIPLEKLRLTGVVLGASPKALFEGPDGKGYVARIGDGVGTNRARIDRITTKGVIATETWRTAIDGIYKVKVVIPRASI